MEFEVVLEQTIALLQRQGRISYGALKRRFQLDDAYLEDLKVELIEAQRLAYDENGRILVWAGETASQPPARDDQDAPVVLPPVERRIPDAERRQLTVMFCDLVDSTRLASQLDPEDWREVVRAYQETAAVVIQRFDGHIAQYLGDGLLVYFGYPQAHEDDARRSVRTGLDVVEALRVLNARLAQHYGVQLAVRIGIHTGLVVVGEMGGGSRQEQLALGDTPNVAARIQGLAAPDTVVISPATFRLVRGYVLYQDLGTHALKGLTTPMQAYRILGDSTAQSRLDVVGATGLTPLVGRDSEVALLLERWVQSQDGAGQVVLLRGEAGIGKSRLVEVLRERVISAGATRMVFRCSPYHQNSVLYPVIDHLQQFLQWQRDETPEAKFDTLERVLRTYLLPPEEVVPLFAALLSVPLPERYRPLNLTPERQRQKTHEALVAWLLEEVERQPVLAVWEDLHWADPSTLDVLRLMLHQVPTARMLTLLTCRPEFRPPWATHAPVTQVTLNRLGRAQVEAMIPNLTDAKTLPAEMVEQVIAKTDGVPLFVEELVKMILESGLVQEQADRYVLTGPLPPLAIPSTLHDSLMARLDRLSAARELVQLGAVLGREFAYELLQAVAPVDEITLQQGLNQLVDAELVYQRGLPPQATYLFKHALIQDAAYQSLLKSTRQQYHQRIAQVLEAQFPETAEVEPELLAHHYTEASFTEKAVHYWHQAGQRAIERSAYVEAIAHLRQGLALLETLPETPECTQHKVEMHIALGASLIATQGPTAPEVAQTYFRAQHLCEHLEAPHQLFPVLRGLWNHYLIRAELQRAQALGEQLLSLAQHAQNSAMLVAAHAALGRTLMYVGAVTSAHTHFLQGMALYDPRQHRASAFLYGEDAGVNCQGFAARMLWHLGYPDQGLAQSQEAVTLAQQSADSYSLSSALHGAAVFHHCRRDVRATQERAEATIRLATEQGFPHWMAMSFIMQGWALVQQGQAKEGMAQMTQGLRAYHATGAAIRRPHFLALLAEAHGTIGQPETGLTMLTEALTLMDTTGERWYEPELYRLKGELLLAHAMGHDTEAETCFRQALEIARRQQAKSWELRAALSLSRLWQRQGKRDAARELLAEVYGWFTEGFDTADLQEAKALLEELA